MARFMTFKEYLTERVDSDTDVKEIENKIKALRVEIEHLENSDNTELRQNLLTRINILGDKMRTLLNA